MRPQKESLNWKTDLPYSNQNAPICNDPTRIDGKSYGNSTTEWRNSVRESMVNLMHNPVVIGAGLWIAVFGFQWLLAKW